jgi:pyridoxal phosphate enzyme (YggS family)
MSNPIERFDQIIHAIRRAEHHSKHPSQRVRLLAVSKKQPIEVIIPLYHRGQHDFGENYTDEALPKIHAIRALNLPIPIDWHFIGRIQSNKTKIIAEHFQWVHSLSHWRHAQRLHRQRPSHLPPLNVLIQVNLEQLPNKSGLVLTPTLADPSAVGDLIAFAKQIQSLNRLCFRGLMYYPNPVAHHPQQFTPFKRCYDLFVKLQTHLNNPLIDSLSMGTSDDYHAAIDAGSTWVRLGEALFGPR